MTTVPTVCVIGIWHLGAVTAACLAELGYPVVGVDADAARVEALNRGTPPLYEPGLEELLRTHTATGRLRFTTSVAQGVRGAQYVLIAFDTPVDENDEADLSPVAGAVRELAPHLQRGATVVMSSQVPVGTCEELAAAIHAINPGADFGMACTPENLRLGQAIERFLKPDMLVIGADTPATAERVAQLYAPVQTQVLKTTLRTAEMTKHAINAYLATAISFGNELANICDQVGVDAFDVVRALRMDARVSPRAPLLPGLGFAGGTLARDMKVLHRLAQRHRYPAHLVKGVLAVNRDQNGMVVRKLRRVLGTLAGRRVGLLGLTYKAGTSTLRRSAAVEIAQTLAAQGAAITAHDPMADPVEVAQHRELAFTHDPYAVAAGAHALVVVTAWPQFQELDYARLRGAMAGDVLLDPQNCMDPDTMRRLGFRYYGTGRGERL